MELQFPIKDFFERKFGLLKEEGRKGGRKEGRTPLSLQTFSVKGQIINILGSVGHTASVTTILKCFVAQKQSETVNKQMGMALFQ